MDRNAHYNPFGPKSIISGQGLHSQNSPSNEYTIQEKWFFAVALGCIGGGMGYLLYRKKFRGPPPTQPAKPVASTKQPTRDKSVEFSCIQDLPAEIRTRIWKTLPYEDLLKLRLTSQFTKFDIDTFVGVSGRITTAEPQKYDFYQNIALQSCKITELQQPINEDFFLNPNVLETLEIREHSPIPLENIRSILSVSINLKSLKLRLTLNGNTQEISRVILEYLPEMKSLTHLHVKTTSRHTSDADMKTFTPNEIHFSHPKRLKTIFLEMPDVPQEHLSLWKRVLDQQSTLENITCNLGNLHWRFYEQVLRRNHKSIEKLVLEGLRAWDLNRDTEDPFDWNVLSDFTALRSIDLCCNRGGSHDLIGSVNFEALHCTKITEFFVSRILMSPQAVDRVYTEMVNLQRGALDNIGNPGIERANEMAWIVQQQEGVENERWWHDERLWDLIAHGIFGLTMALVLSYVVRNRSNDGNYALLGNELQFYKQSGQQATVSQGDENR